MAAQANKLAAQSRSPGAPRLTADSTREALIAWLQWNDPNGCHTDALAEVEGIDPYTTETAWDALREMIDNA